MFDKRFTHQINQIVDTAHSNLHMTADCQQSAIGIYLLVLQKMMLKVQLGWTANRDRPAGFSKATQSMSPVRGHEHKRALLQLNGGMFLENDLSPAHQNIVQRRSCETSQTQVAFTMQFAQREWIGLNLHLVENMLVGHNAIIQNLEGIVQK